MKNLVFLWLLALLTSCSSATTRYVTDIESIEPQTINLNEIQIAVKDFVVVKPVFATTSVNMNEMLTEEFESGSIRSMGSGVNYSKADSLHKIAMSGSYIIQRKLLDEAFKADADGLANINIEYEKRCHEVTVEEGANIELSDTMTVPVVTSSVSIGEAREQVSVNGHRVSDVNKRVATTNTVVSTKKEDVTFSAASSVNDLEKECILTVYGTALAIKYTNAIHSN